MLSTYLQAGECASYGIPNATAAQVQQASGLIDTFLKRPEGLVWAPDAYGQPAYMAALSPSLTINLAAPIGPGANVTAIVTGPAAMLQSGDVLVVDRLADGGNIEALVIASMTGQAVTFRSVGFSHASGAALEFGLQITEQKFMPKSRPITRVSRTPVARIVSGSGRYGYSRRGEASTSNMEDFNLLAALSHFGGPPVWEAFDPSTTDVDPMTGQCWVPAGIMLAYYTEVKIRYVAGYQQSAIPDAVKRACAALIQAQANDPGLGPVKSYKAGDTAIERFADTLIGGDIRAALMPLQAKAMS